VNVVFVILVSTLIGFIIYKDLKNQKLNSSSEEGKRTYKQSLKKAKNILLVLLSIGLTISLIFLNKEEEEDRNQYEGFLNRFYMELSPTIDTIEWLLSNEKDKTDEAYQTRVSILETRLAKLYTILDVGDATLTYDIHHNFTFALYAHYEDINEKNKKYLKELKEVLLFVQKEMYSEETRQEDPNLTVEEFNQIIDEGTELYRELLPVY